MSKESYVYKIQDTKTGLFSTGGSCPSFTKNGKCWSSRGALKAHLTQYVNTNTHQKVPASWDVICYVVSTRIDDVFSAKDEASRPAKK